MQAVGEGLRPRRAVLAGMGLEGLPNWERRAAVLRRRDRQFRHRRARRPALAGDPVHEDDEGRPRRRARCCSPTLRRRAARMARRLHHADAGGVRRPRTRTMARPPSSPRRCPTRRFAEVPGTHMSSVTKPELGEAIADFLRRLTTPALQRSTRVATQDQNSGRGCLAMKFAASVSLAALALAGCADQPAAAADAPPAPRRRRRAAADRDPPTAEGARAFVAAAEKDLFDLSRDRQPRRLGQRDLHQRRHRRARRLFRHDRHREGRQIRHRGGALCGQSRASTPTPRASSTSCAAR